MELSIELAGLKLKNPTLLAAGVFGVTGASLKRVAQAGAGAVITKSISLKPNPGCPNPTIVEVLGGFLNAMGLPNPGCYEFSQEIKVAKEGKVPVIANIYGSTPDEFAQVGEVMEGAGADGLELNVSCPHSGGLIEIGQNPELTAEVVRTVKKKVRIPVMVKLSSNVSNIIEIAKSAERAGADIISAINSLGPGMVIDIETASPILANKVGGFSGPCIKPVALRCIYEISKNVKIPVVGVGGITSGNDAIEFFMAGAKAIQIGTGIYYHKIEIFKKITDEISDFMDKKGYKSLNEIIGLVH
ncbi:MAG: dihydroorotate dehydrogenase [Euryarchaeota archaeon]|nr:dihydroorotate dehydrogenase [Euryarchaeota archaeon]